MKTKKKDIPEFEDVTLKQLFDAMLESYKNAEDYYENAILLYEKKKYGHSLALSSLGIEELGKSVLFLVLFSKKLNPDIGYTSKDFQPENLLEIIHKEHKTKHQYAFILTFLNNIMFKDIMKFMWDIMQNPFEYNKKRLEERGNQIMKQVERKRKGTQKWLEEMEFVRSLQKNKEIGLYVGLVKDSNEIQTPSNINYAEARRAFKILIRYLDEWEFLHRFSYNEKQIAYANSFYRIMRKINPLGLENKKKGT